VNHKQSSNKESDDSNEGGQLQGAQAHDCMTRGTTASVSRSKADQESSDDEHRE